MLSPNQEAIIKILQANKLPIKTTLMANSLNVSERTIRNTIHQLNTTYPSLLTKHKNGYTINDSILANELIKTNSSIILTQKQREEAILKILINNNSLNYFDTAEQLFVSEHTVEADLSKIKKNIKPFHLELFKHNSEYILVGQEEDKRKLISTLIYDNSKGLINDYLENLNQSYDITVITSVVKSVLLSKNLKFNSYSLNNLIVHVVVFIDRLCSHNTTKIEYQNCKTTAEYEAAISLSNWIEKIFNVNISENEIQYLAIILKSKTTRSDLDSIKKESNSYPINFESLTEEIIYQINKEYALNINGDEFFSRFLLHLYELNKRIELQRPNKNPFSTQMKLSYPFIYEIGVFISNILLKYGLPINDDEITYLAFHIGSYIEENSSTKLPKIALFMPNYLDMQKINEKKLSTSLKNIATIIKVNNIHELENYDFILSPINNQHIKNNQMKYIQINPFVNDHDIEKIKKAIKSSLNNTSSLISKYTKFCSPQLFVKEHYETSPKKMIHYMCSLMEKEHIIDATFEENVLKREALSPTTYMSNIALPHSLTPQANISSICIVINKKAMHWSNSKVNIIIMIAGSKNDRFLFRELTDALTSKMYDSKSLLSEFLKCDNYEDVLNLIFS